MSTSVLEAPTIAHDENPSIEDLLKPSQAPCLQGGLLMNEDGLFEGPIFTNPF